MPRRKLPQQITAGWDYLRAEIAKKLEAQGLPVPADPVLVQKISQVKIPGELQTLQIIARELERQDRAKSDQSSRVRRFLLDHTHLYKRDGKWSLVSEVIDPEECYR